MTGSDVFPVNSVLSDAIESSKGDDGDDRNLLCEADDDEEAVRKMEAGDAAPCCRAISIFSPLLSAYIFLSLLSSSLTRDDNDSLTSCAR